MAFDIEEFEATDDEEAGWRLLADAFVALVDDAVGGVENTNLTALHLAIADQAGHLLNSGVPVESIDPLLEMMWHRIKDRWARGSIATHQNTSLRPC